MTATASLRALLDAVNLADRLQDGFGALLGVEGTSSERRAVSLAFDWTWSIETSISFIDELVSSAVRDSASTFLATSLIEYAISSIELTVSRTLPASSPTFLCHFVVRGGHLEDRRLDSSALEG